MLIANRAEAGSFPLSAPAPAGLRLAALPDAWTHGLQGRRLDGSTAPSFRKWQDMVQRAGLARSRTEAGCGLTSRTPCGPSLWRRFLDGIKGRGEIAQLNLVNRYVNRTHFREDAANWGRSDYWASPREFFARGGDCEDYAIAKYYSLTALGLAPDRLRIVVLRDTRRRLGHAVLVVKRNGQDLILDNVREGIVPWRRTHHYVPIYSINERSVWLHTGLGATG